MVMNFYKNNFWTSNKLDDVYKVDKNIAEKIFDISVNMGNKVGCSILQTALNYVSKDTYLIPDGVIGDKTIQALTSSHDYDILYKIIVVLQGRRYLEIVDKNPKQKVFLKGWIKRAFTDVK